MKSNKILTASLLSLSVASAAFATDQTIKITGSTAYRKALYAAIVDVLGSGTCTAAFKGSNLESANQVYFDNGLASPNHIVIQTCMAGSIGGVNWVANELDVATAPGADTTKAWMSSANARLAASVVAGHATGGNNIASPAWEGSSTAKVTMSDSYQDSSQFNSNDFPALEEAAAGSSGIVTFSFAKGQRYDNVPSANYARLTNVTPLAYKYLAANGTARLSLFTGDTGDTGIDVVLVGRDNDSGTRLVTQYETGYGTDTTTAVQFRGFQSDGTTDVGLLSAPGVVDQLKNADLVGANPAGLNGYPSGGQVKNLLLSTGTPSTGVVSANGRPAILVAYLGTADSPGDSQLLTYNGNVINSTTVVPTQYGKYSFWANEHMYFGTGGNTPAPSEKTTMNAVNTKIITTYAGTAGGLLISSMHASRSVEGGPVTPLP